MRLYSKSAGGFYDTAIHKNIPSDAVEVSDEDYQSLLFGQSAGQSIAGDELGHPFLAAPPAPTLDETAAIKRAEINRAADAALAAIITQYPRAEIDSWQIQLDEANAYTADSNASTPFIDGLVARRPGVDKTTLVSRILANAAAWTALSSDVFGQRQALDDQVTAATTVAEVEAIVVDIEVTA